MDLVKALSEKYLKPELPEMNVGDTVRVLVKVKVRPSPSVVFPMVWDAKRFSLSILLPSSP